MSHPDSTIGMGPFGEGLMAEALQLNGSALQSMVSRAAATVLLSLLLVPVAAQQLSFSQAVVVTVNGNVVSPNAVVASQSITVPVGKVWKIESVAMGTVVAGMTRSFSDCHLVLDGVVIGPNSTGYEHAGLQISPIWLPAGSYTLDLWDDSNGSAGSHKAMISVLEFTL